MPRIPLIQAEGGAGILRLPRPQPVPGFAELTALGEGIGKLAAQQDDQTIHRLDAEFDVAADEIKLTHADVADPDEYAALVQRDLGQRQAELLKGTTGAVQRVLGQRFALKMRKEGVTVGAEVFKRRVELDAAGLLQSLDALARQAAVVETDAERTEAISGGHALIARAEGRRILSPLVAQRLRASWPAQVDEVQALRDIRLDPTGTLADLKRGGYGAVEPEKREQLIRAAESRVNMEESERREQLAAAKRKENVDLFRALKGRTLTQEQVLGSRFLDRGDMDFFMDALAGKNAQTDPATFIAIDELLASEAPSREGRVQAARAAKRRAQAEFGKRLSQEDSRRFLDRANKIILGEEPEREDRWFKAAKRYVSDRFGGQIVMMPDGHIEIKFLDEKAATIYHRIVTQLMVEQEDVGLGGRAIFERATELVQSEGAGYWMDHLAEPGALGEVPAPKAPPSGGAVQWRRDPKTGKPVRVQP